jgi:hypothetical protein
MKSLNYLLLTITATTFTCTIPTTISQVVMAQSLFPSASKYVVQQSEQSSTVMMVQLPQMEVNIESERSLEIIGQLAVPLQLGERMIPVGALVQLTIVSTDTDARLVANTIILPTNGATISISAEGAAIPKETVTDKRGADVGQENAAIGSYLGQNIVLAVGGSADEAIQGGSVGGTVASIIGLASPSKRDVVRLVQGVYSLNLR